MKLNSNIHNILVPSSSSPKEDSRSSPGPLDLTKNGNLNDKNNNNQTEHNQSSISKCQECNISFAHRQVGIRNIIILQ